MGILDAYIPFFGPEKRLIALGRVGPSQGFEIVTRSKEIRSEIERRRAFLASK